MQSHNGCVDAVPSIAEATVVPHYDIGGGLIRVSIATTEEVCIIMLFYSLPTFDQNSFLV